MRFHSTKVAGAAVVALAATAAMFAPFNAQAQNAPDQAGAAANQTTQDSQANSTDTLQEVVVTAERRAVDVQSTPIAVTAISGDQLMNLHLNTISDLQITVPSFQSNDEAGFFNSINIRGMGNSAITPIIATGVAVFRDGLLMSETIAEDEPLFDIADTEVLEGPQGTFVGASSTAGAVEINSVNPSFNGMNGYILGGIGNYSDTKFQGAVNLPISDTFAARLAFNNEQRNSFYNDVGATQNGYYFPTYPGVAGTQLPLIQASPGQSLPITDPGHSNERQMRLSLLWKPTDNFQALGKVEYSYINTGGEPAEPNPYTYNTLFSAGAGPAYTGCTTGPGAGFTGNQLTCPTGGTATHSQYYYPGEQPFVLDYYGTGQQEDELLTHYGADLRYTLPDGIQLRSLSGFVHIDINHQDNPSYGPWNAGWQYHEIGPNDDYMSEEINIISPTTGRTNWIAGAFWDYRDTPVFLSIPSVTAPYQPNQLPAVEVLAAVPSTNRIAAVFGQFSWQIADTLQLQVGARENWDNNFSTQSTAEAPALFSTVPAPSGTGVYLINYTGTSPTSYTVLSRSLASGRFTDSVPTGKIDLNWTPAQGQNFYVFFARGYKSGGDNAGSTDHPIFNPEHVNDYELGWKGRLADGHVFTQVSAYYVNYQNMQYQLFDPQENSDTTTGTYVANLAASTIYGLEVSEQSRFGGLGVNLGFDYNHSALGAVTTLPSYALPGGFGSPTTLPQCLAGHSYSGGTACFNYNPYLVNVSGEQNPFSPLITLNLSVDYQFHVGNGIIDPRVTFSHIDQQYASIFEVPYNVMQARNLLNASADWIIGKWDAQLYGTNLEQRDLHHRRGRPRLLRASAAARR